jgi:Mce-associated membrane protein
VSIRLSTVVVGVVIVALLAAACVFGGLWLSARGQVHDRDARAADQQHAEQVATDYAVGAANMDYKDLNAWIAKLKANTTPQLSAKFDSTVPVFQQLLTPPQWTSSATPIAAKVTGVDNGVYKVSAFVNETVTSAQSPAGRVVTAAFDVTVDKNQGWKIADVGNLGNLMPTK